MKIKWEVNIKLGPLDGVLMPWQACVAHWSCQATPPCPVYPTLSPSLLCHQHTFPSAWAAPHCTASGWFWGDPALPKAALVWQHWRQALDTLANQCITPLALTDKPQEQSNSELEHKGFKGHSSTGHVKEIQLPLGHCWWPRTPQGWDKQLLRHCTLCTPHCDQSDPWEMLKARLDRALV